MQSGQLSIASATYRSECECRAVLPVGRGDEAPPCPKCGDDVAWTFVKSTFVAPTETPPAAAPPSPRRQAAP